MNNDSDSDEDEGKFQLGQVTKTKKPHDVLSQQDDDEIPEYEKPNYAVAMEYWNTLLPRRIKDPQQPSGYRQALVGELCDENGEPAELYDFFRTDSKALDEFGIGMSLYFRTLKILCVVCFVCALILLVSVDENMKNQHDVGLFGAAGLTDVETDIGTCEVSQGSDNDYVFNRSTPDDKIDTRFYLLGSVYGATPQSLKLNKQGAADIAVCVICLVLMLGAGRLEKREVEAIDLSQQTTQDYSIVIKNPPAEISNPEEYYEFFSKWGEVVTLTVALNNGGLMKACADRKALSMHVDSMRQRESLKTAEEKEQEDTFLDKVKKMIGEDLESSEAKLKVLDAQIMALSNCDYRPWRVFVSFNKEGEQLRCLDDLAKDEFNYFGMNSDEDVIKFHGNVLNVAEAPEPTDVIYDHSHRSRLEVICRLIVSYVLTGVAVFIVMLFITLLQDVDGTATQLFVAFFLAGMNAALPIGIRILTQIVEAHSSETGSQRSVLIKLIIARCMNSAVLIYVLTPWHDQFSSNNLEQIQIILLTDAVLTPFIRYLSAWEIVKRHILAPCVFGATQAGYNSQFQGTKWTLAERYTDVLKSVFAGFFFAVPLPTGLFITSLSMITNYMSDKYNLMRIWERKPTIDHSLAKLSRYFLITTLWAHLFISLIYFANWPYSYGGLSEGQSCDVNCPECPNRVDKISCTFAGFFCAPDSAYMTDSQYDTVLAYLILSFGVGICIILFFVFVRTFKKIIASGEKDGVASGSDIPLRTVFGQPAYVPTMKLKQITAPFVFSDVAKLPVRFSPVRESSGWDETIDAKNFSLVDHSLYPGVSAANFRGMFSTTTFYEANDVFQHLIHRGTVDFDDSEDEEDQIEMTEKDDVAPERRITENDFNSSTFLDDNDLPGGWERRITVDGRQFYVDHNDMRITYAAPPSIHTHNLSSVFEGQVSKRNMNNKSLPSFRKKQHSFKKKQSGTLSSKESFKKAPNESARHAMLKYQSSRSYSTDGLPAGWEQKVTDKGRIYYIDHNAKETHWEIPSHLSGDNELPDQLPQLATITSVGNEDDFHDRL